MRLKGPEFDSMTFGDWGAGKQDTKLQSLPRREKGKPALSPSFCLAGFASQAR